MLDKIADAIDKWFEVWLMAIVIIMSTWVIYRIIEFLI